MNLYEFTTYTHFGPALINEDYSGLETEELEELDRMLKDLQEDFALDFITTSDDNESFSIPDYPYNALPGTCSQFVAISLKD